MNRELQLTRGELFNRLRRHIGFPFIQNGHIGNPSAVHIISARSFGVERALNRNICPIKLFELLSLFIGEVKPKCIIQQ
jgi:hypothetical protein